MNMIQYITRTSLLLCLAGSSFGITGAWAAPMTEEGAELSNQMAPAGKQMMSGGEDMMPSSGNMTGKRAYRSHQWHPSRKQMLYKNITTLTPEQKQKIEAIDQKCMTEITPIKTKIHQERETLMQYMKSASANEATALQKQRMLHQQMGMVSDKMTQSWFEMRGVLTAEQLKTLETVKQQPGPMMKKSPGVR
jgi:Spy/CpxP family protein refolding chaperone